MRTISIKLPESIFMKIQNEIEKEKLTKSELIRLAVKYYFSHHSVNQSKQKADADSFYAKAKDLCGVVKLSANLSHDKKMLEGYGE